MVRDDLPDDPGQDPDHDPDPVGEPFGVQDGLVVVPRGTVDVRPACGGGRSGCGGFEFQSLTTARTKLARSGLNYQLQLVRITDFKKATALLEPAKKAGTVDTITNFVSGQVLAQKETIDKAAYKKYKVKPNLKRLSTLAIPYQVTLTYYEEPVPDPDGACPYNTGVYRDVDPRTKGRQEYDVVRELAGPPGKGQGVSIQYALEALQQRFDCSNVTVTRTLFPGLGGVQSRVTDVVFDASDSAVEVFADVPARADLVTQLSGRSRSSWLNDPANAATYDSELGPLVDGTLAVSPANDTVVSVRLLARGSGAVLAGGAVIEVIDPEGRLAATAASSALGDVPVTFRVRQPGTYSFLSTVTLPDGSTITGLAQRRAVDAGEVAVTSRGAVFRRTADSIGEYLRDTQVPLTGSALSSTQSALDRMDGLLAGAPGGTALAQARAIVEANAALRASRPAAVLRQVHEQTGFELASLHQNASTMKVDEQRLATPTPGAVVVVAAGSTTTGGGYDGQFFPGVRPATSGVTAVLSGPEVTLLGGNVALGRASTAGGFVANGRWLVDQGAAPRAADPRAVDDRARRAFPGDQWNAIVSQVRSLSRGAGESLLRFGRAALDGARRVVMATAGAVSGAAQAVGTFVAEKVQAIFAPAPTVPERTTFQLAVASSELAGTPLGSQNFRNADGSLIANDGAGLIANDGAGLQQRLAGASVTPDGNRLIANDGAALLANDGGSLLANDGGSLLASSPGNLIANDGAGLIANDGAGLIANDGAGIVAGGAGN